jgi:hypothetical protein
MSPPLYNEYIVTEILLKKIKKRKSLDYTKVKKKKENNQCPPLTNKYTI